MADFIARIKPKRSTVSGEVPTAADLEVGEIAVSTADGKLFVKHSDDTIKEISGSGGGGDGGGDGGVIEGSVRETTPQVITPILATGTSADVTLLNTARAGQFISVESSCASWITFYSSKSARTADAGRAQGQNPGQGNGVLMEVFTDQAETVLITPAVHYFNDEPNEASEIYAKVVNLDNADQAVTINATVVPIEGRALYGAEGSVRTISPTVITSTLADSASEEITLTQTAKSGQFISVSATHSARVVFYSNLAARTADTGRVQGTEPLAGSGVLLEVITTGEQTLEINPSVLYANTEQGAAGELYLSVTNLSGADAEIGVTATVVPIEGRGVYLSELHELLDVEADSPAAGQALIWDETTGKWIPGTVATDDVDLSTESIDALSDVDTSTTPALDGQALVWDNANQNWVPGAGGGAVDSVNGETGVVSLGIQDMDDFGLNEIGILILSDKVTSIGSASPDNVWSIAAQGDELYFSNSQTILSSSVALGDAVTFQVPGMAEPFAATVTTNPFPNFSFSYFRISAPFPTEIVNAANGTALTIVSSVLPASPAPLAEGDILQWVDADQTFKPAQLPAAGIGEAPEDGTSYARQDAGWVAVSSGGGGGAVDSVNGETGVVSLGIQEMDDFELATGLGQARYEYSTSQSAGPPSGVCANYAGSGWAFNTVDYDGNDLTPFLDEMASKSQELAYEVYKDGQLIGSGTGFWNEQGYTILRWIMAMPNDSWKSGLVSGDILTFGLSILGNAQPLTDGDILQWNSADNKFKPAQLSGGSGAVSSLSQVGDVISYGSAAQNTTGVWNSEIVANVPGSVNDFPDEQGEWASYVGTQGVAYMMVHFTDSNGQDLQSLLDSALATPSDYAMRVNVDGVDYGGSTAVLAVSAQADGRYRLDFDPTVLDPATFNEGGYDSDNDGIAGPHSNTLSLTIELSPVGDVADGDILAWNSTTLRWENGAVTRVIGGTFGSGL